MKAKLELTAADLVEAVTEYVERRGYAKAGKVELLAKTVTDGDAAEVEGAIVEVVPKPAPLSSCYDDGGR